MAVTLDGATGAVNDAAPPDPQRGSLARLADHAEETVVNKALLGSLTEAEWLLVQESEPDALAELDEDELLALHGRVQRARTKYVKVYRRGASAAVAERGGRGLSHAKNQRARDKAEIFETVLARVSRRVGVVAQAGVRRAAGREDRGCPRGQERRTGGRRCRRWRGRPAGQCASVGGEDHRGDQAGRVVAGPGLAPSGGEGLPLSGASPLPARPHPVRMRRGGCPRTCT